ncbi:MAG: DUF1566 domain-containing protein [Methylovulum sp.]|jgi:hypothetical protein|nr:DUF1566 domain-containing protein [Methylovulum sp.]
MKKFKLSLLTAILLISTLRLETHAELTINRQDKTSQNAGQNPFLKNETDHQDGKVVSLDSSGQHHLEVKTIDEPDSMTWDAAVIAVQKHGLGWRLPTIVELKFLYEQRKLISGFSDEDYWSSTERDINSAWIQGFRVGDQDRYIKHSKLKVRAVRSF